MESPTENSNDNLESLAAMIQKQSSKSSLQKSVAVLQHYPWSKIAKRGLKTISGKLNPSKVIGRLTVPESKKLELLFKQGFHEFAEDYCKSFLTHPFHSRSDIELGKICLLNQTVDLSQSIEWQSKDRFPSHLWSFHFHYHEYLLYPAANEKLEISWDFVQAWIENHRPENTRQLADAWHPYCISRRIPVWIMLLALSPTISADHRDVVLQSLIQQATHLKSNLELDIGGNHLLENLAALALIGGVVKREAVSIWDDRLHALLERELKKQILDSGEHFERCPAYHCQMVWILLRVVAVSEPSSRLFELCKNAVEAMLEFLVTILHPDGEIPLFGDSGFYEAPSVETLRQFVERCEIVWPESRAGNQVVGAYSIFKTSGANEEYAIVDGGPVAPDELPAHGHCDLGNFELSIGKNRWLVDSGNFNYEDDSMRAYCRSSLAHNVVTIENQNQCDIWSKFRMGRRARITDFQTGESQQIRWTRVDHNAYSRTRGSTLTRLFAHNGESTWVCIDFSSGSSDPMTGYLHLAPRINCDKTAGSDCQFDLADDLHRRKLIVLSADSCQVKIGWYCPAFGMREASPVIAYSGSGLLGWVLTDSQEQFKLNADQELIRITQNETLIFEWKRR